MRKIRLLLAWLILEALLFASITNAGCVVTEKCVMYFDPTRFIAVSKVCAVSLQQGTAMMIDDINSGTAVMVDPGTKLDDAAPIPQYPKVIACRIGQVVMVGLTENVRCE